MTADDLELRRGTRLLHIGPHKTGSSALQSALHLGRDRLAARDIVYPGQGRQTLWPILAVTGQPALLGEPVPRMVHWHNLVRAVRAAGDQRVVLSSEFLSEASDAAIRRIRHDLGDSRVHVVVTLRPLASILPSQWQQYVQNGFRMSYGDWLTGILSDPPDTPTPGFWRRHRHDELVARWAGEADPESLTVIVLDESDRRMLLDTFEAFLGLPEGFLQPDEDAANRSLTMAEAELVRQLNHQFKQREWPDYQYAAFMRYGAVRQMKAAHQPGPGEERITAPAWAQKRAAEIGAEMAEKIAALGVRVVGDLSTLAALRPDPAMPGALVPPQASHARPAALVPAQAVHGSRLASAAAGQATARAQTAIRAETATASASERAGQTGIGRQAGIPGESAAGEIGVAPGTAVASEAVAAREISVAEAAAESEDAELRRLRPAFAEAESPVSDIGLISGEAAVNAIVGAFLAGGIAGRTPEDSVRGVASRSLAKLIVQRGWRRVLRKLRLH